MHLKVYAPVLRTSAGTAHDHEREDLRRDRPRRRAGRRGGGRAAGRSAAGRSRSSRKTWSAANAPTTPACPRRRCCAPPTCWPRRSGSPACRSTRTPSSTRRRSSPAATRRSTTRTTRASCPGSKNGRSTSSAATGRFVGEGRIAVGERRAGRDAGGGRRHRLGREDAADRRPRLGPRLEQPRRDHGREGPGEHDRARRRAGRLGARPGLGLARHQGDAGRRRPTTCSAARSPSPAKNWRRRCAGASASTCGSAAGSSRCAPAAPG